MVDQTFAFAMNRYQENPDLPRRTYYLGISVPLFVIWGSACAAGVLIGTQISKAWSLDFSLPLVFLALAAITVKSKAGVIAAIVGGCSAAILTHLPNGLGLIVATCAGIAAALISERWLPNKATNKQEDKA